MLLLLLQLILDKLLLDKYDPTDPELPAVNRELEYDLNVDLELDLEYAVEVAPEVEIEVEEEDEIELEAVVELSELDLSTLLR